MRRSFIFILFLLVITEGYGNQYEDSAEVFYPSNFMHQHQWITYELFEKTVGFSSKPMHEMMQQLAPNNPDIWDAFSECVGNLLLANLYLNSDTEKVTKAVYELRFHSEMTHACIHNTLLLSLFNKDSYLSKHPDKLLEILIIDQLMENALESYPQPETGISHLCSLIRFKCLNIDSQTLLETPLFHIPLLKVADMLKSQEDCLEILRRSTPLYFQCSAYTFVPEGTDIAVWANPRTITEMKEDINQHWQMQLYTLEAEKTPNITFLQFIEKHITSFLDLPSFGEQLIKELDQFALPLTFNEIDEDGDSSLFLDKQLSRGGVRNAC